MRKLAASRAQFLMIFVTALIMVLFPPPAEAHLNCTGLGHVYDGALHFLLSPEDLLPVVALALLAGLRGASQSRMVMIVLPAASLLGGFIGLGARTSGGAALTCISFLLLGGLLAADAKLSLRTTAVLAALIGLLHGYLNGAAMERPEVGAIALLGLVCAVFVLATFGAAFAVPLHRHWARIAVRVVGSWIVASGLLMLGWALRRS
jgi:urease accessory protein